MRYVFLINPAAGKGELQPEIEAAVRKYFADNGGDYTVYVTKSGDDMIQHAVNEAKKGDMVRIFACGGEGTVFDVLNGIIDCKNAELGVIPCGSANDFLKFFDDKAKFCNIGAQINGESVPMDLIKAGEYYCLNGCSVGMDAMVANDMNIFKSWPLVNGKTAYKLAIVKTFLKKLGVKIKVSIDGETPVRHNCLFAVVANAPYYGGGYKSAPDAVPYDGKLDFTVVDVISKLKVPKFLSLYEKGKHAELDYCHLRRCKRMEFTSAQPVPVNLDGEIIQSTGMSFEIVKGAVNFIVPEGVKTKNVNKFLNCV